MRLAAGVTLLPAAMITSLACSRESATRESEQAQASVAPLAAAESVYYRGEYDSAKAMLAAVVASARTERDTAAEARALTWLGLTAWREGDYATARSVGEKALQLKLALDSKPDLFRSYNALGLLAHNQGRYRDAIELFTRAESAARTAGDSASVAKAHGNRALSLVDIGDFDGAREGFDSHRRVAAAVGDTRGEANALANLAMLDIRLGDAVPAMELLARARLLYRSAEFPAGEENVFGQLATAYELMGDPQRSIAYLDSAIAVARAHGFGQQESENLQILAGVFGAMGDHTRALEYLARAREISIRLEQVSELGDISWTQAVELAAIGRLDAALDHAVEARSLHDSSSAALETFRDDLLVAELSATMGRPVLATEALRRARQFAASTERPLIVSELALGTARVADIMKADEAVLTALARFEAYGSRVAPGVEWEAHALRARAYRRAGSVHEAATAGRLAVQKLEEFRQSIRAGVLRTSYLSDRADTYGDVALMLLEVGDTTGAFAVADAARGRALLDHLGMVRRGGTPQGLPVDEQGRLLRRIDWLVERLNESDTIPRSERGRPVSATLTALQQELVRARTDYEAGMRRVSSDASDKRTMIGGGRADLRGTQSSLRPDEAILQYLVTPQRLVTFIVTRDTLAAITTTVAAREVSSRVRVAIDAVRGASPDRDAPVVLRRLHSILIEPAERTGLLSGKSTLIVVPHSSTVHLPFAALLAKDGRYLVERRAILTLPSAAALSTLRRTQRDSETGSTAVLAPFPDRLPGSAEEAWLVKRGRRQSRALIGDRATEEALRIELQRSAIVHVASHAALNEMTPMFSGVELARARRRTPANDGRLEIHEILGLALHNELVFLSGCETAAGLSWSTSFRRSQDHATLSQAFLFAGARNVVATLWLIDDRGAADFARFFYRSLEQRDLVQGLALAQREMIKSTRYAAPRYWAAFTISGAGNMSPGERLAAR